MLIRACLLCASILLVGCKSTGFGNTMLDVAPKDDSMLAHPDWGSPQESEVVTERYQSRVVVEKAHYLEQSPREVGIEAYLIQRGLRYQILPGEHLMIHLTESIHFNTDSTQISSPSKQWLKNLAGFLATQPNVEVVINGHTDNTGQNRYNDNLSERRAASVKQVLLAGNMPTTRLFTRAYGEYLPACSNQSSQGRSCNRRVELVLLVSQ